MTLPIPHVGPGEHIREQDFLEQLRRALNAATRLTRVWRVNVGSVVTRDRSGRATGRFSAGAPVGAADLTGIAGPSGKRLEIELKVSHKHTPEQVAFGQAITRFGGIYLLIRYDTALSLAENVERGVKMVDEAIAKCANGVSHVP